MTSEGEPTLVPAHSDAKPDNHENVASPDAFDAVCDLTRRAPARPSSPVIVISASAASPPGTMPGPRPDAPSTATCTPIHGRPLTALLGTAPGTLDSAGSVAEAPVDEP